MEKSSRDEIWNANWNEGRIDFHKSKEHPVLVKYYGKVTGGVKGLRFYVPLCGKSVDMKWLCDKGQQVVGVEIAELACKQFFEEHSLEYSVTDIPSGKLFTATPANIKIYKSDVLALTSETLGKFDVVWDRGSLGSMEYRDRDAYAKMIKDVTRTGTVILLETLEHDIDERIIKGYHIFNS